MPQSEQNSLTVLSSCDACPLQEECDTEEDCAAHTSPCTCTMSRGGCVWESGSCTFFTENVTDCTFCPRQLHCNPPQVIEFQPEQDSQEAFGTVNEINVSFDRPILPLGSAHGQVALLCAGSDPMPVPDSAIDVPVNTSLLRIKVDVVENPKPRQCELLITDGALVDADGLTFQGIPVTAYSFFLRDTKHPAVVEMSPRMGATSVSPDTAITISFDEDIFISVDFEAVLVRLAESGDQSDNQVVVRLLIGAPEIEASDEKLVIGLAGYLESGVQYSLYLKTGSVIDAENNGWTGQMWVGYYTFSVGQRPTGSGEEESFDMRALVVALAILALVLACGGGMSLACGRHGYKMRQDLARKASKGMSAVRLSFVQGSGEDGNGGKSLKSRWSFAGRYGAKVHPESRWKQEKKKQRKKRKEAEEKEGQEEDEEEDLEDGSDAETSQGSEPEDSVPENPQIVAPVSPPGNPDTIDVPEAQAVG